MKTYTKNQVEAIFLKGVQMGIEIGNLPKDRQRETRLPTLEEAEIYHSLESSDDPTNMAHKRPWLDGVGPR